MHLNNKARGLENVKIYNLDKNDYMRIQLVYLEDDT